MPTSTPPGNAPGNRAATVVLFGVVIAFAVGAFVTVRGRGRGGSAQSDAEVAALLLRQTEEISSASQTGEAAVLARYLDPAVIFTSEEGTVAGKDDTVAQTRPRTGPETRTAKVTDFTCRRAGDTAATSFVDELTEQVSGQTLTFRYRSTEAWRRNELGEWRLLASETLTLPRDVFFVPEHPGTRKIFHRDASGHVTGYVSRNAGGDLTLAKSS